MLNRCHAAAVISHTSSIFSRHGVPEILVSDGGPPYNSKAFRNFSKNFGFHHIISRPEYPQGNAEAERAVQTMKNLLKKSAQEGISPYLAMLAYRTTPWSNGYSPAQLLMGRQLRSPLPVLPSALNPSWPPLREVRNFENTSKTKIKENYDKRKRTIALEELIPGDRVFIKGIGNATVTKNVGNRSYIFQSDKGGNVRRNRRVAVKLPCDNSCEQSITPTGIKNESLKLEKQESVGSNQLNEPPELRRSERSTRGVLPLRYRQ